MSSLLDSMRMMNEYRPFEEAGDPDFNRDEQQGGWDRNFSDPNVWAERYAQIASRQHFNPNIDGFIAPYASSHWGASSDIMMSLANNSMELGPLREKLDPNKIFTSNIAALKTIAADQAKTVKIFERKLLESLTDKGKFGLNEDDIEAMQALTSARTALANIEKEQIAVRKSIAELKIKQQSVSGGGGPSESTVPGRPTSAFDVGRSIMDSIFDVPEQSNMVPVTSNYPNMDIDQASDVLNNIIDEGAIVSSTKFESDSPTTYVVVGESDSDYEFATYSSTGELLPDYPNPTTKIQSIDRQARKAVDELLESYPIKDKE